MLGANTTITVSRFLEDGNGQKVYTTPHHTCSAYVEPAGAEIILASGGPVGQTWAIYVPKASVPATFQISDLCTDSSTGEKYILTGIQAYQNHLQLTATQYDAPSF